MAVMRSPVVSRDESIAEIREWGLLYRSKDISTKGRPGTDQAV